MDRSRKGRGIGTLAVALVAVAGPDSADLAVTANDSHSANVNGIVDPAKSPPPDTVSVIDVSQFPPKAVATVVM